MEIKTTFFRRSNRQKVDTIYRDVDNLEEIAGLNIHAVHAFCFCKDKMVVVYSNAKGTWDPPGGGVEAGETIEEAVVREVKEETNMKVLKQALFGIQINTEPNGRQTAISKSICLVVPYGKFVSDPGGDITEIGLFEPQKCKELINWGPLGNRTIDIALEKLREFTLTN